MCRQIFALETGILSRGFRQIVIFLSGDVFVHVSFYDSGVAKRQARKLSDGN